MELRNDSQYFASSGRNLLLLERFMGRHALPTTSILPKLRHYLAWTKFATFAPLLAWKVCRSRNFRTPDLLTFENEALKDTVIDKSLNSMDTFLKKGEIIMEKGKENKKKTKNKENNTLTFEYTNHK